MPAGKTRARHGELAAARRERDASYPLVGRLGLSVPREWWPAAPLLKSYEAAGFAWVQLHSPPRSVLRDPRQLTRHGSAAGAALATTGLRAAVHAPAGVVAGTPDGDRALEGLLWYAAEAGAGQVVYHALALPDAPESEEPLRREAQSLAALARVAERLEVTIAIENVCPVFPGPETVSANPLSLRGLANRISSDRVALCLDLGHAHVIADLRHTWVDHLVEPVLDLISLFHVHDNLGARWQPGGEELGVDPLRLDLHLPPGRGTLPWKRISDMLTQHAAPLILEVHPPYRPRAPQLHATASATITQAAIATAPPPAAA
jgi:sugar phosphate isomerase/epimerase